MAVESDFTKVQNMFDNGTNIIDLSNATMVNSCLDDFFSILAQDGHARTFTLVASIVSQGPMLKTFCHDMLIFGQGFGW